MATHTRKKADRLFVRDGRRHYRRRFSTGESRIGFALLLALAGVLTWVAWKGANPDPTLFMLDTDLAQAGPAMAAADRGPLPETLAAAGWSEGTVSSFDFDNLYVKINGREGYYKAFGFEELHFVSLQLEDDPATAVDIELYNQGSASNAIGAYAGERSPDAVSQASSAGLMHYDRNALYMTRGRYYLRAIGSEESPVVREQLEHVQRRFEQDLPGEALPWGFALFVGEMGIEVSAVAFKPENAYSFGFASNVYSADVGEGTEMFVMSTGSKGDATALAARFREGFSQYGSEEDGWIRDRYLNTYAGTSAVDTWVAGVYRATDTAAARDAMRTLAAALADFEAPAPDNTGTAPGGENAAPADAYNDEYNDETSTETTSTPESYDE